MLIKFEMLGKEALMMSREIRVLKRMVSIYLRQCCLAEQLAV